MKRYLITGASRGIGHATTLQLAREGHQIVGIYNSNKAVADSIADEFSNVEMVQCDFSDRANTLRLIRELEPKETFDGFVNSAAVFAETHFEEFDVTAWDTTMEVNVTAPLLLASHLEFNDGASIVNLSSTHGMAGIDCGMAYAASKAVWINLTQSMAVALKGKKIRVNAVAPGLAGDAMQAGEAFLQDAASEIPLRRIGTYDEVANVICFLLSDKASYVSGVTMPVDGGEAASNRILDIEDKHFPAS